MSIERLDINDATGAITSRCVAYGDMVHIGGITARDTSGDVAAQMRDILDTVDGYLAKMGASRTDVLTVQVWIKDMALFADMTAVWNEWVDPKIPPARACVSGDLYRADILVEVTVTAVRGNAG